LWLINNNYLAENEVRNVFWVADYESEVKIQKFKMADLIWRIQIQKTMQTHENVYLSSRGFSRSLITNPWSDSQNSRWQAYGGQYDGLWFVISDLENPRVLILPKTAN